LIGQTIDAANANANNRKRSARDDDGPVVAKIDHLERRRRFDFRLAPYQEFLLLDRHITDDTIALIAKHRFQKADLYGLTGIEHAKTACRNTPPRIAEPARRLPKPRGSG